MKITNIFPDRYFKSFRELFVIFISIVLAFLFDDYRENKNENNEYKKVLLSFTEELVDELAGKRNSVDSFRVLSDNDKGIDLERLLNLKWFETKLKNRQATMADLEYILKSEYLMANITDYGASPLSEELRTKFEEQIDNRHLLKWLRIYEEEKKNLLTGQEALRKSHELIDEIIYSTNPYFKFSKQDSILIYSNEFIWKYRDIVRLREGLYYYNNWLVKIRLRAVYEELKKEIKSQGLTLTESECWTIDDFKKRFECENSRPITKGDSVTTIAEIAENKRMEYMEKRAAHNNVHVP